MSNHLVITTVGADRPGIVEEVAGWVAGEGGNITESRMAQLGGEFATIILVSGGDDLSEKLSAAREEFEAKTQLAVFLKPVSGAPTGGQPALRYTLQATSLDHAGIVHQVAGILRGNHVNIVSAETRTVSAPFTGAPVFQFKMEIDIPAALPVGRLRSQLEEFGDRESIDFTLTAK